jgi:hypothetical protein
MMSERQRTIDQTWVASGPAGAVGVIHRTGSDYAFRLLADDVTHSGYPSLAIAKSALHAHLAPGTDWPDFTEH